MMKQQIIQKETNQLPYIPIKFVYSGTIGNKKGNSLENIVYQFKYKDILVPRYLNHHNPIYYLFFHTPTIYNWIRQIQCRQSQLLNQYITEHHNSINSQRKFKQETITTKINVDIFKKSLDQYLNKWQVAKISFSSKLFIQNVKGQGCNQISKTQVYSNHVHYFPHLNSFEFIQYYCKQCSQLHEIQAQVIELSNFIILYKDNIYHKTLNIQHKNQKIAYNLYLLMTSQSIFIKCANKIWYQIKFNDKNVKPIGIDRINFKNSLIGAYSRVKDINQSLIMAKPLQHIKKIDKSQVQNLQAFEKNQMLKQQNHIKQQNDKIYKSFERKQSNNLVQKKKKKKQLKQLSFKPNTVIIKQTQMAKQYIESVSKHFNEPKVKDQYELNYDKGKLKKIKQKRTYIRPDFNQIHKKNIQKQAYPQAQPEKTKKIKKKYHHKD